MSRSVNMYSSIGRTRWLESSTVGIGTMASARRPVSAPDAPHPVVMSASPAMHAAISADPALRLVVWTAGLSLEVAGVGPGCAVRVVGLSPEAAGVAVRNAVRAAGLSLSPP